MAEKKESYSEEELNEMIVWFNNHADELPKEMQINKAAFTPNLKLTVESCIMQAKQCLGNYKMAGAFRMLQQIRENLELLIVDESGQVSPELAVPSFSLAKQAILVGEIGRASCRERV